MSQAQIDAYQIRVIIGAPVYDGAAGRTKNYMHRLKPDQDFSQAPLLSMIATQERAKIAAEGLVRGLQKSGVPSNINVEILHLPPFGFEIRAKIDVNNSPEALSSIDDVLAKIGIEPELV